MVGQTRHQDAAGGNATVVEHPAAGRDYAARRARPRPRHRGALASFALMVVLPGAAIVAYLFFWAADQYASSVSFSVRSGDSAVGAGAMAGLMPGMSAAGTDAEIVYEFVRSQPMVEAAMTAMPLEAMFNRAEDDVVFRLGDARPIEDVHDHWLWMTDVSFDAITGLVRFEAKAFAPDDAERIAAFVLAEAERIVARLSDRAQADALAVAEAGVDEAAARMRETQIAMRAFRAENQEVDPVEGASKAVGIVAALEGRLAETLVELDSQRQLLGTDSPRLRLTEQRADSLRRQIRDERARLGVAGEGGAARQTGVSAVVSEYEELAVDMELAKMVYASALSSLEAARVDARRESRFLVPHVGPTRSVEAQYPQRYLLSAASVAVLALIWAVLFLVVYNVRDRR